MRFQKKTIVINGKKVFYWQKHNLDNTVVVFLHGFPGSHKGLIGTADEIEGYGIIIPDLPACGQSEPLAEKHSLKNYAKWLNEFLENLSVKKVVVVGHSFGARVALVFSLYYPKKVEKMVLITPVAKVDSLVGRLAAINYKLTEFLPVYFQDAWLHNIIYRDARNAIIYKSVGPKRKKQLIHLNDEEAKNVDIQANLEISNEFYGHDSILKGEKIGVKTLLIACDKDEVATVNSIKELSNRFTNAEIKVMKNSGHLVVLERPKAVGEIIYKWLK